MMLMLTFVLVLVLTVETKADTTQWQIEWDEDFAIVETVHTYDQGLVTKLVDAGFSRGGDEDSYYRQVQDWESYNNLAAKFPILSKTRNFIILSVTTINLDKNHKTNILQNHKGAVDFEFSTLGIFLKNSGQKIGESTYQWRLGTDGQRDLAKPYFTKCVTFNGFVLGLSIFLIGVTCISIFYSRKVRYINRLITEEYSIENYLAKQAELQKGTEEEKVNEN